MPVKAHPSSKAAGGQPRARRASRSRGATRRGGGRRRRSLTRRNDLRTDEFEGSSDSSENYMRLGRIGPANSLSRDANSDSYSQSSDQDKSNLSNDSSDSDGVFQQRERAAMHQQQQPVVPLESSIAHPKNIRLMRLCSHHRRELIPAARDCDDGNEFGQRDKESQRDVGDEGNFRACASRTGEGGGGRVVGKVTLRSCSPINPSSSFTRSGEPSSQIAYQAALSPLTSDSNDQSPPAKRRDNRDNRNNDRQSVRPPVRDANTSNRQEPTKRRMVASRFLSSPSLSPSPRTRHRQRARRESRWESRRGESRGESRWESRMRQGRERDRYSKFAEAPFDENYSNFDDIYDKSTRRDCRRLSPSSCQRKNWLQDQRIHHANQSKQHQNVLQCLKVQSRQRKPRDNIYVGNHVESDILEGRKLNSLRRLYSMRSQRYENDDYQRTRKSEPERQVLSWEESDREQQSPGQRHLKNQQHLQLQYQQQQQQQCIQKWKNKVRNCRIGQNGVYHDDDYRENIYWDDEPRTARGGNSSSRRQSWRPRPACQLSPAWSNDLDDACSGEVFPPRSGDGRRNCEQGRAGKQWGGHNNQLAERRQSECMSSRLEDRGKRDMYGMLNKYDMLDRYDRYNRVDTMNHGSREDDTRRPQTWSLRQTEFEDDAGDRVQNDRRVKSDERRHWCDGTGRMRETRSRRETIFSCPYVSLALQTKTYECDRCAGYSSYTNNLNSNPSRLRLDDTASQDSWATPEFNRSRDRRSRTHGEKEEGVGHTGRYRHPTSGPVRNRATSRSLNE